MAGTFAAMGALGWNVIPVPHGHNLQEVYLAVEKAVQLARENPKAPVCLLVKTIKGYGVQSHGGKRLWRPRIPPGQR